MTQPASYTETEWKTLCDAPMVAGSILIAADFGLTSFVKEVKAAIGFIQQARTEFAGTPLVEAIVDSYAGKDAPADDAVPEKEQLLAVIGEAVAIVDRKAPAEAARYKQFLYRTAETVANAAGEGWFGTGPKVSADEQEALDELKRTLRM